MRGKGETGVEACGVTRRTAVVQSGRGTGTVIGRNQDSSANEENATAREQKGAGKGGECKQSERWGWLERYGMQCKYTHGRTEREAGAAAGWKWGGRRR